MLTTHITLWRGFLLLPALITGASSVAFAAPSVTNAAAAPNSISVNVPTAVTFTAVISDPTVISAGVNLLRLRSTGQPLIVGALHDDGLNGDAVAGDGTYSLHVTLNETSAQAITFQVSAAFRGLLRRVLSSPVTVTVAGQANRAPTANAGPDQANAHVGAPVSLNGSGSSDPDGNPLTFQWHFTSVPAGSATLLSSTTAVTPSFIPDRVGTYVVELIVNDGTASSAPDAVTITVANTAPVAKAGPDFNRRVSQTAQLDGSASSDADGDPLTFAWSFMSRPAGSSASLSSPTAVNPTFLVDVPGTYVIQLIVNDGIANSSPDSVTVTTQNSPPIANAGADQTAAVGDTVTLNGSASSDGDGDPLTYRWAFQSRPQGSAATLNSPIAVNPTFLVDVSGTYVLGLIVNDGQADSAADTVTISTQNSAPVANAGPDQTVLVGQTVTLDGTGSSDVDGNPLTYAWTFVSRPAGSNATLLTANAVQPSFVADRPGTYQYA